MNKYYGDTHFIGSSGFNRKPKHGWWKWVVGIFITIILIFAAGLWGVVIYFSPERIEKIIAEKSPEFIDGEIKIGKLDYSLFRSWPWLTVEVDSLQIISKSLNSFSTDFAGDLPEDFRNLAFIEKLKCSFNIKALMKKELELRGIEIVHPSVNVVIVNDSANNFDIFPHKTPDIKLKKIKLDEIELTAPADICFYYLPEQVQGEISLTSFLLEKFGKKGIRADLNMEVAGKFEDYSLPDKIPVSLSTTAIFDLSNITVNIQNFSLAIAGNNLSLEGDIQYENGKIEFNKLSSQIYIEDLFKVAELLPAKINENLPVPTYLSGNVPINLNVSILQPFLINVEKSTSDFSLSSLPPFSADLTVDGGALKYSPAHTKPLVADDIFLNLNGTYDPGNETFVNLSELRLHGEGISIEASAEIKNLMEEFQPLQADVKFHSNLIKTLSYIYPKRNFNLTGDIKGDVVISAILDSLGKSGVKDILLHGNLSSASLDISQNKGSDRVALKELKSNYSGKLMKYPATSYAGSDFDIELNLKNLTANFEKTSQASLTGLKFKADLKEGKTINSDPEAFIGISINTLSASRSETAMETSDLKLTLSALLGVGNTFSASSVNSALTGDEAILEKRIRHTPLYLVNSESGILQSVMSMATMKAQAIIGSGSFHIPEYLSEIKFSGVGLNTNLNDLDINISKVSIDNSSFSAGGKISGLGSFLNSYTPTLLKADMSLDFENVDINGLAGSYYGALINAGQDNVFFIPPLKPYSSSDSTCVVIPRNLDISVNLNAASAEYMEYRFSPLSTKIILKDGVATLKGLSITAPYGNFTVDWTYSTANLSDIFMNLHADINNFSFEPFYRIFPQLTAKAPEIKDLTGLINSKADCKFLMFPSMFMNPESLSANFDIMGKDLQFAREGKIEKLTHLMLIDGNEPIRISNLDIKGSFHDNLLELNPFKLKFDNYQIGIGGINNMQGEMLYHIALEKSPFHVPFGVTLKGKFSHPEIRLGGTEFKANKDEEKIASDLKSDMDINIMASLKRGWLMFIQAAAKYGLQK